MKKFNLNILFFIIAMSFGSSFAFAQDMDMDAPIQPATEDEEGILEVPQIDDVATVAEGEKDEVEEVESLVSKEDLENPYLRFFTVFDGENIGKVNYYDFSMLFDNKDLKSLNKAVLGKDPTAGLKDLADTGVKIAKRKIKEGGDSTAQFSQETITVPTFHLKSMIYFDENRWTSWLNDKKLRSSDDYEDGVKVTKITENYIEFTYTSEDIPLMCPDIEGKLEGLEGKDVYISNYEHPWQFTDKKGDVLLDVTRTVLFFRLQISQTFSVFDLKISEGYVAPVDIVVNVDNNTGDRSYSALASETDAGSSDSIESNETDDKVTSDRIIDNDAPGLSDNVDAAKNLMENYKNIKAEGDADKTDPQSSIPSAPSVAGSPGIAAVPDAPK